MHKSSYCNLLTRGISSWTLSYWGCLSNSCVDNSLLNSNFFTESLQRIFSFKFLKFHGSILIKELINWKISTSNSYLDIVFLHFDSDSLSSKLIDTFCFSHKHNLQFCSFWIVIDEFRQLFINSIFLHRNINCNPLFQIYNVLFQCLNFNFSIFQLL